MGWFQNLSDRVIVPQSDVQIRMFILYNRLDATDLDCNIWNVIISLIWLDNWFKESEIEICIDNT